MPDPDDSFLIFETTYSRTTADDFNFGPIGSCVLEPAKPFGFTDSQLALAFEEEIVEAVELGSHEQLFQNMFPDIVATIAAQQEARPAEEVAVLAEPAGGVPEVAEPAEGEPVSAEAAEEVAEVIELAEGVPEMAQPTEGEPVSVAAAEPEKQMPVIPDAVQQFPESTVTSDSNLPELILAMSKIASKTAEEAEKLKQMAAAEPGILDAALIQEVADEAAEIARKAAELQQRLKELDLTGVSPGPLQITLSFLGGEPIKIPGPEDSFLGFESTYSRTTADDFNFGPTGSCVLEPAKPFGFTDSQLALAFEEEIVEPVELGSHEELFQNVFPGIVATIAAQEEARLAALQQLEGAAPGVSEEPTFVTTGPEDVAEPAEEAPEEAEVTEAEPEPTEEGAPEAEVTEAGPEEAAEPTEEAPEEAEVTEAEPEPTEEGAPEAEVTEAGPEEAAEPTEEAEVTEAEAEPTEEEPPETEVTVVGPEEEAEPAEEAPDETEVTEAGPEEAAEPTEEAPEEAEVTEAEPEPTEEGAPEAEVTEAGPEEAAEPAEEAPTEVEPTDEEAPDTSAAPGEVVEQVVDLADETEAPIPQPPAREPQPILEKVTEDVALNDLLVSLQQRALSKSNEILEIKKLLGDLDKQQKNLMATLGQAGQAGPSTTMPMPEIGEGSGMIATIAALQEKCRLKDHMIGVMVDELRTRTQSGVWENLLTNIAAPGSPQPDFTRSDVSERLRTGQDKPPIPKQPCDCSNQRTTQECPAAPNIPTFSQGGPTLGVAMPSDSQCVCPTDFRIIRQIGFDSLLLSWKACTTPSVVGYEIYVNGMLAHKVRSNTRDRALLQCLDMSIDLDIKLFARLNTGQLTGGAQINYSVQR